MSDLKLHQQLLLLAYKQANEKKSPCEKIAYALGAEAAKAGANQTTTRLSGDELLFAIYQLLESNEVSLERANTFVRELKSEYERGMASSARKLL